MKKQKRKEKIMKEILITIISLFFSFISVSVTLLTYKQKTKKNKHEEGKCEGLIISDVKYIKGCVDRCENTLNKVSDEYHKLDIRITKLEEKIRKED